MTSTQSNRDIAGVQIREMSVEEGRQMFDEIARKTVNMSGEEFIQAWESGQFDDQPEVTSISRLVALIPLTR